VFLSVYNDEEGNPETEQIIAINPKIAIELMESAIEKKLIAALQNVKQFKRNVPMKIENKIDSCFTFVGMCDDEIPFIMEVHNVPFAEYNHGQAQEAQAPQAEQAEKLDYDSKVAYFPEKNNTNTIELLKVVRDLITIKSESNIRCMLGFVIERTDIERFEISKYNSEYRAVVKEAIDHGIDIIPLVISWTKEGIAFFVTDELPVVYPHL
jgi:DNA-binding sugar fermentation-stimulating protein